MTIYSNCLFVDGAVTITQVACLGRLVGTIYCSCLMDLVSDYWEQTSRHIMYALSQRQSII